MEYIVFIESKQRLDNLKEELEKNLGNIKIKKIIQYPSQKNPRYLNDFISILKSGPKIELNNDNITREWIHEKY